MKVNLAKVREDVRPLDEAPDHCCGQEIVRGYGLAYGGMGPYAFCERCGRAWKTADPEDEDECSE